MCLLIDGSLESERGVCLEEMCKEKRREQVSKGERE